jgi:hypothetical protein
MTAYAPVAYTGDGSTTDYLVPFTYLSQTHVKAALNGSVTTAFTWLSASTIKFDTAPASGVHIRIFRDSDSGDVTTFSSGYIRRTDLNRAAQHPLFLAEEVGARAISVRDTDDVVYPLQLPSPESAKVIGWSGGAGPYSLANYTLPIGEIADQLYTPDAVAFPNTYSSQLRQKLEWDLLSLYDFLTPVMRSDPLSHDCRDSFQKYMDFLKTDQSLGVAPIHVARLGRKAYALTDTLVIQGLDDPGQPRQGRIWLTEGSLVAMSTGSNWSGQLSIPKPLVTLKELQGGGMHKVTVNAQGYCSGILAVNGGETGSASKYTIDECVVTNFSNPQRPTQADLYSNLVTVSGQQYSAAPARRYETSPAHPYGIRCGPTDPASTANDSATSRISGCHVRQWDVDRPEQTDFRKRTGIAVWLAANDSRLCGKTNNLSDVLKGLVLNGGSNFITSTHISPSGPASEYDGGIGPDAQVTLIGSENLDGINYYQGVYHERCLWVESDLIEVLGCHFPRKPGSTDGTNAAIVLNASSVNQEHPSGRPFFDGNKINSGYTYLWKYREADGFNWLNKVDVSRVDAQAIVRFQGKGANILTSGSGDPVAAEVRSSAQKAYLLFRGNDAYGALPWVANTGVYFVGDKVLVGTTMYTCLISNTASADFATDLAAGKWGSPVAGVQSQDVKIGAHGDTFEVLIGSSTSLQAKADGIYYNNIPSGAQSRQRLATQFDKTNTSLQSVFGNVTLAAGKVYEFTARLLCAANATGGVQAAVSGSVVPASIAYAITVSADSTAGAFTTGANGSKLATALNTAIDARGPTSILVEIKGTISVTTGGTINIQFAQGTGSGTSSVLVGSYFEVKAAL